MKTHKQALKKLSELFYSESLNKKFWRRDMFNRYNIQKE